MEWKHSHSPPPKKVQNASNLRKVTVTVFRTRQGYFWNVIKGRVQKRTVLKLAVRRKWRGLLSDGIVLFHDTACPHTVDHTAETLKKLNFELLEHPPYSPDLTPSDYHLFSPLKQVLRGRRFTTDQQLKETVHA